MGMIKCPECGKEISDKAEACPNCGAPMAKRCPKCGSTNIEAISGTKKGLSAWALGVFAANTIFNDYKCRNCGNKFK